MCTALCGDVTKVVCRKIVQSRISVQRISWVLSEGGAVLGCAIAGVDYLFRFIDRTDSVSQLTAAAGCFLTN